MSVTVKKFRLSPLAIHQRSVDGTEEVRLAIEFSTENLDGILLANIGFDDHGRSLPMQEITFEDKNEVHWRNQRGDQFIARAIQPSDAPLAGVYSYDLPVPVLSAMAFNQLENQMTLQAIVDRDDNRVLTLLLATDAGLFARYDTLWHPVTDPEVFEDAYMIDVHEDAIQLYDAADSIGGQVAAASLPTGPNTFDATVPPPTEAPITASAPIEVPLIIETADELDEAITAAVDAPDIRWYVEKRAQALGVEVEFPWA